MIAGIGDKFVMARDDLQKLLGELGERGYRILGPTRRDGAIVYDDVAHIEDLPQGWTDRQDAGSYRLERRAGSALFGFAVGAQSWKRFLHPPIQDLWRMQRDGGDFSVTRDVSVPKFAFFGVRACELHAISIQDKVFLGGPYRDADYARRREDNFFIAVNCSKSGGTCFCVSMKTGPKVESGFDLALTELQRDVHEFLVEIGSESGGALFSSIPARAAKPGDVAAAEAVTASTTANMGRTLDTRDIRDLLLKHPNHPRWEEIADRCLTCANCTMVCPTCFCTTVEDRSDLAGEIAVRERRWDSCFTLDFSYLHGGSVRKQASSRYRQWLSHKLASWIYQFGTSGCVGCGRCITWCPVGIDITEEVAAIRTVPDGT